MEQQLHREHRELRRQRLKVKGWWFRQREKHIFQELHPEKDFRFSNCWFTAFKRRFHISYRRPTNVCQKEPSDKERAIRSFHSSIWQVARGTATSVEPLGKFSLERIANVDQTPLPFCFTDGTTYNDSGSSSTRVRSGASGQEKRQCTVQITLFANGEPRVKPLVIFRGEGLRIAFAEKVRYDTRVTVVFQPNAWCDEPTMAQWIRACWRPKIQPNT